MNIKAHPKDILFCRTREGLPYEALLTIEGQMVRIDVHAENRENDILMKEIRVGTVMPVAVRGCHDENAPCQCRRVHGAMSQNLSETGPPKLDEEGFITWNCPHFRVVMEDQHPDVIVTCPDPNAPRDQRLRDFPLFFENMVSAMSSLTYYNQASLISKFLLGLYIMKGSRAVFSTDGVIDEVHEFPGAQKQAVAPADRTVH